MNYLRGLKLRILCALLCTILPLSAFGKSFTYYTKYEFGDEFSRTVLNYGGYEQCSSAFSSIKKCGKVYLCFDVLAKSGTIDHLVKKGNFTNLGYGTRTIYDRFGKAGLDIDPWTWVYDDNGHITHYNRNLAEVKRRGLSAAQCYASVKDFFDNPNYKYYSKRYSDPFKKPHKYAKTSITVASGDKTFGYLQDAFKVLPTYQKKNLQRILKDQKYYSSTIDGIFGRQTWKAIVAYSDKNRMRGSLETRSGAKGVLASILKGPQKVEAKVCNEKSVGNCINSQICRYATSSVNGQDKEWSTVYARRAWVAEAKRRNLSCGVTDKKTIIATKNTCADDPKFCGAIELCQIAVKRVSGQLKWETRPSFLPYVEAAKKVGLTCNVQKEADSQKLHRVASGTGFFVTGDGTVVTNSHVIRGCNETRIHSNNNASPAKVVADDPVNDLAILKSDISTPTFLKLSPDNPYLLQDVIASGYPFGNRISKSIKVTRGVVSSLTGIADNVSRIQIDAAIQPGNSGGPLLDEYGNVVGVAVAKLDYDYAVEKLGSRPENVNFGIKVSVVKSLLDSKSVNFEEGQSQAITNAQLGKLANNGTVFLSCWMTEAQYEKMREKKAMFKNVFSK